MIDATNVLVVAAHPDDEVLGLGGTIPLLRHKRIDVCVLIATDGSSSQYPGNEEILGRKKRQLEEANKELGTSRIIHWDLPDMRLESLDHVDLNKRLEELIRDNGFETIFVHHPGDINLDHQVLHHSVMVACRPQPGNCIRQVLEYRVNSSTEWGEFSGNPAFRPNLFVDIERTIETKLRALACYVDELREYPHPRSLEAVRARDRVTGIQVGWTYAEAFRIAFARSSL